NKLVDCDDASYCSGDPKCKYVVSGKVVDGFGHPMKYVYVGLVIGGESSKSTWASNFTDEKGVFEIDYTNYMVNYLQNRKPGDPDRKHAGFFNIVLHDKDERFQILYDYGKVGSLFYVTTKEFEFPSKSNYLIWLNENDPYINDYTGKPYSPEVIWGASYNYYLLEKVFTFVKDEFGFKFQGSGNSMPLKAYIYSGETNTAFYSPSRRGGGIFMSPVDSRHDNTQNPENGIWHEFFHACMYNQYGSWSSYGSVGENHAGFKNENTGDSFEEAFAEFWPNIVSKKLDGDDAGIYAGIWNMELNYKSWTRQGFDEEFSFASMLWDLTDDKSDSGDDIQVDYHDLWTVLMSKPHRNMKSVYDSLVAKWPKKKSEIDGIFVSHGLFKDTGEGNGKYDVGEPFWDVNNNYGWDIGESFIDVGTPESFKVLSYVFGPYQVYNPGNDTIGTPSNYERPNRINKPLNHDSYVSLNVLSNSKKVDDGIYKIKYKFKDSSLDYETYGYVDPDAGKVYVELPPGEYEATAQVSVDNYEDSGITEVSLKDYYSPETAGRGYMKSATLYVGEKKENYCRSDLDCDRGIECVDNICGGSSSAEGVCCLLGVFSVPAMALGTGILLLAVGYIFYRKKGN
ncbi:MAG: hypothetical protein KKD39_02895, partial [Candidatus Altiarchaeota archaeon]|nr:hypothetical protein [Candidatus Altiarchaeota archaeon]